MAPDTTIESEYVTALRQLCQGDKQAAVAGLPAKVKMTRGTLNKRTTTKATMR